MNVQVLAYDRAIQKVWVDMGSTCKQMGLGLFGAHPPVLDKPADDDGSRSSPPCLAMDIDALVVGGFLVKEFHPFGHRF
jgi:hypothetical protein